MLSNTNKSGEGSELSNIKVLKKDSAICDDDGEREMEVKVPDNSAGGLRTHALWNFCKFTNGPKQPNIEGLPLEVQEKFIMTELLYVLVGMRGTFIAPDDDEPAEGDFNLSFKISQSIHPSLREVLENIIPLASHYICIQKFVEKAQNDDAGAILQALSSSLNDVIHDYYNIIAQLEDSQMESDISLQKLYFTLRPTLHTIKTVANLLAEIMHQNLRGSAVLTFLCNATDSLSADEHMHAFVGLLLKNAAAPYIRTLELWLKKGVIIDPSHEFLIEDVEQSSPPLLPKPNTSLYWDQRYKIHSERIPDFLKDSALKILKTGKYLSVVFKCYKETKPKKIKLELDHSEQHKFLQSISEAYTFSTRTLLKVFSKDNNLLRHLWSVKHFLLLSNGDFVMKFLDKCDEELSKNSTDISSIKVNKLIQLILGASSLHRDPHKKFLHCKFWPTDLNTQVRNLVGIFDLPKLSDGGDSIILNGYQSIGFEYAVPWPISLIMNDFIICKYQMIFRLLFYCKHVENELCKTWKSIRKISREASVLRFELLSTIQNYDYYITVDVIEPNWQNFIKEVKEAEDFDQFIALHSKFIDEALKQILISDMIYLTDDMIKIFGICLEFCKVIKNDSEQQASQINNLGLKFRNAITKFLSDIQQTYPPHKISSLADRINFNDFYIEKLQLTELDDEKNESET